MYNLCPFTHLIDEDGVDLVGLVGSVDDGGGGVDGDGGLGVTVAQLDEDAVAMERINTV